MEFKAVGESKNRGIADFTVPEKGQLQHFFAQDDSSYELIVSNQRIPIEAKIGKTVDVRYGRIEVDNVLVTREDGKTFSVHGQFLVTREIRSGEEPLSFVISNCIQNPKVRNYPLSNVRLETGSGVNLPFDHYIVRLEYSLNGVPKSQIFHVTLDENHPVMTF